MVQLFLRGVCSEAGFVCTVLHKYHQGLFCLLPLLLPAFSECSYLCTSWESGGLWHIWIHSQHPKKPNSEELSGTCGFRFFKWDKFTVRIDCAKILEASRKVLKGQGRYNHWILMERLPYWVMNWQPKGFTRVLFALAKSKNALEFVVEVAPLRSRQ